MPEVPPVMRTVLFSKVFIVGLNVAKTDFLAKFLSYTAFRRVERRSKAIRPIARESKTDIR
jgi:hypothetical protein